MLDAWGMTSSSVLQERVIGESSHLLFRIATQYVQVAKFSNSLGVKCVIVANVFFSFLRVFERRCE